MSDPVIDQPVEPVKPRMEQPVESAEPEPVEPAEAPAQPTPEEDFEAGGIDANRQQQFEDVVDNNGQFLTRPVAAPQPSNKWWWDKYNYNHRNYSYGAGSGSRSWMDRLYGGNYYWSSKKKEEVYQNLLDQLQNSANIIGSDTLGKVAVHWSDGKQSNDLKADASGCHHIYLSPDNLVSGKTSCSIADDVLDAMTGKVYLASTLRETVSNKTYHKAKAARAFIPGSDLTSCVCGRNVSLMTCCGRNLSTIQAQNDNDLKEIVKGSVTLWEAIETSIARHKIMQDWSGFGSYIANDAKRSSSTKQEVQEYIDSTVDSPNMTAAILMIAWNLLNSEDLIKVPNQYLDCAMAAAEMLAQEIDADHRYDACKTLAESVYHLVQEQRLETSGQDGNNSQSGSNQGQPGEQSSSPSQPSPSQPSQPKPIPVVCDSSMLGQVQNNTDQGLSQQKANQTNDEKNAGTSGGFIVKPPESMSNYGEVFDIAVVKPAKNKQSEYNSLVANYSSEIRAIRSSLLFRNNIQKMVSYGHRSGDIDENSLFKIRMNDDRVMTKQDFASSKKIAICLLIDESGSMMGENIEDARGVAVVISESLRNMEGMAVSIYGHDDGENIGRDIVCIREYYSPRQRDISSCLKMRAEGSNYDSWAMQHVANVFNKDYYEFDRKIMFLISDGLPNGSNYGGSPARKHMKMVSDAWQKKGLEMYGIGIGNAYDSNRGKEMYGENKFTILNTVRDSLGTMARFIRQVAMRS